MGDEEEYAVETILRARVEKKTSRSKFVVWKYLVKWKGYDDPKENTWEPIESFEGSEHFVETFWRKIDTGGRDREDLSLFEVGEELEPGSLARKSLRKSLDSQEAPTSTGRATSKKRKREQTLPSESTNSRPERPRARKRTRNTSHKDPPEPSVCRSSMDRDVSFELADAATFPDEDAQYTSPAAQITADPQTGPAETERPPRYRKRGSGTSKTPPEDSVPEMSPHPESRNGNDDNEPSKTSMPAHHARTVNPLVKMIDGVDHMEGAISAKARLFTKSTSHELPSQMQSSSRKYPKPGPTSRVRKKNTSSLLTAQKGKLTILKGKYNAPIEGKPDQPSDSSNNPAVQEGSLVHINTQIAGPSSAASNRTPATSQELLQLAGADAAGDDELKDYEDDAEDNLPAQSKQSDSLFQQSIAMAKDKLFPTSLTSASLSKINAMTNAWRSTIFGPLSSSSTYPSPLLSNGNDEDVVPFFLNIDVSTNVPIVLTKYPNSGSIPANTPSDPPGKFYGKDAALAVLNTLRTGGPSARVSLNVNCTEEQRELFHQFMQKLAQDMLFVAMAGSEVLAFCSTSSVLISSRLNFPSALVSASNVLVGRVTIQDHSAYANVALQGI